MSEETVTVKGVQFLKSFYQSIQLKDAPALHIVLGSGLAPIFEQYVDKKKWTVAGSLSMSEIPGLVPVSVPGHKGQLKYFKHLKTNKVVCFQLGRLHGYEGHDPALIVRPLMLAREAGTEKFILTNAAGALNKRYKVGSVMLITDQVNFTGKNPLYGPNPTWESGQPRGPRFPDMSQAFSAQLTKQLSVYLKKNKITHYKGTYLGVLGPSFESPAEVRLFSSWGMGAVGMSTVWETIALVHSGAEMAALSFISNMGSGLINKEKLTHEDVEKRAQKSAPKLIQTLFDVADSIVGSKK